MIQSHDSKQHSWVHSERRVCVFKGSTVLSHHKGLRVRVRNIKKTIIFPRNKQ